MPNVIIRTVKTRALRAAQQPIVVTIEGAYKSGKTTLAHAIKELVEADGKSVEIDDESSDEG